MKRLGYRLAFAVACLFLPALGAPVFACTCLDPGPPCQAYWNVQVVFSGTTLSVTPVGVEWGGAGKVMQRLVRFRVGEAFRGVSGKSVEVLTGAWGGDCGYDFEVGKQYLVYGYALEGKYRIGTGICSRTRPLSEAAEDLKFIRAVHSQPPGATIYGLARRYTVDLGSGGNWEPADPIAGAAVVASSETIRQERTTDAGGRYSFSGLPPGKYVVRVTLPETLSPFEDQTVDVHDRGCAEVDIGAVVDGRVAGRLLDAQGHPLEGRSVDLLPFGKDGKFLRRLWVNSQEGGGFQFTKLPPGRYVLGVNTFDVSNEDLPYRKTFYPSTADPSAASVITLGEGQHLSGFDFRMPAPLVAREITGTVVWPDGRPALGAEVQLEEVESGRLARFGMKTDAAGRFKLQAFEGLLYRVGASIPADPDWNPDSGRSVELLVATKVEVTPSAQTAPLRLVINTSGDGVRRTKVVVGAPKKPFPAGRRRKRP